MEESTVYKPKLIVFDLDFTLWPFWCDTHVNPPFRKKGDEIFDAYNKKVKIYQETQEVLENLQSSDCKLGVASRTGAVDVANQLLELFNLNRFFQYKEIYPGSKVTHFQRMKKNSGIAFPDMLFLDDEDRNIRDLTKLGVCAILIDDRIGVTQAVLKKALETFNSSYLSRKLIAK